MVYSSPEPEYEDINFTTQALPEPAVQVKFNGSGLHKIAGPVPFVNLSKTYTRNNAGNVENIQTTVRIQGQIVRSPTITNAVPSGTGTAVILGAISELQKLFSCTAGFFEVNCNGSGISVSGARVNSFSANRSDNNWTFSADYEAELEYNEPGLTGLPPVKNTTDSWTIEPLEDTVYTNFIITGSGKAEYSNPKRKPAPTTGTTGNEQINLSIVNIPQYKISRRLSAVGFPTSSTGTGCPHPSGDHTAYSEARKWVELKLAESFRSTGPSGAVSLVKDNNGLMTSFDKIFLFNHLRTINFSASEGSYEVNDTWLAMPTGVRYVEDYTLETSTDDRYIKTVRVQGNIKGLSFTPISIMSGNSGLPPTGIAPGKIDLGFTLATGAGPLPNSTKILDNYNDSANNTSHDTNNFYANKYQNALSGWINDIKPYLYRRASIALNNGPDRTDTYIPLTAQNPPPAPKNPIYCRENLLNIIPIATSEGHDPRKGTISYSYEYSNRFVFISGAISENVTINDTGPVDVVNETFVLGRRLGPILQSLGTKTPARKDVTIEVTVLPPSSLAGFVVTNKECPLWTGGTVYTTILGMIEGLKPYGDRTVSIFGNMGTNETRTGGALNNQGQVFVNTDNYTWNPIEGRYTRTIGWTYQACTTARNYIDN